MEMTIINEIILNSSRILNCKLEDVKVIKRLLGGVSHYTYLINIKGNNYTYRKVGAAGNMFVNREDEINNIKLINKLDINNETVYFDVKSGVKIAKYVDGVVLTDTNYKLYLDLIVANLKKLHNSNIKATKDFNMIDRLIKYESFNIEQNPIYLDLKGKWLKLYHKTYEFRDKVICHNDAQRSNMVLDKNNKMYLLDWEYVGNNDFYYDIASFGNVDFNDAIILLKHYLGRIPSKDEVNHIRFYRMFQALMWHQVAKYKALIGLSEQLDIDFYKLEQHYLSLANKLYEEIISD